MLGKEESLYLGVVGRKSAESTKTLLDDVERRQFCSRRDYLASQSALQRLGCLGTGQLLRTERQLGEAALDSTNIRSTILKDRE